ncbi:MAG: hypothetical protein KGJ59_01195 [Bacteroidota bacterium]|nr:hypothetical protein [Bacteroidota bacterium]
MRKIFFVVAASTVVAVIASIASCSGSIPEPTPSQSVWASDKWPGTTYETLVHGRELYIAKCSGCHSLHAPSEYSERRWSAIVDTMKFKAKLNDSEAVLITKYLASAAQNNLSSSR